MNEIEHGYLLSSATHTICDDLVTGGYVSVAEARAAAVLIAEAQPGLEFELMCRRGPGGNWHSVAAGLAVAEVVALRRKREGELGETALQPYNSVETPAAPISVGSDRYLPPSTTPGGIGPLTAEQATIVAARLDLAAGDLVSVQNGILTRVHPANRCAGQCCWVHNPSDHHMSTWPIRWNADSRTAVRLCLHDFGHPDPDDVRYNACVGRDVSEHECDGCCAGSE